MATIDVAENTTSYRHTSLPYRHCALQIALSFDARGLIDNFKSKLHGNMQHHDDMLRVDTVVVQRRPIPRFTLSKPPVHVSRCLSALAVIDPCSGPSCRRRPRRLRPRRGPTPPEHLPPGNPEHIPKRLQGSPIPSLPSTLNSSSYPMDRLSRRIRHRHPQRPCD